MQSPVDTLSSFSPAPFHTTIISPMQYINISCIYILHIYIYRLIVRVILLEREAKGDKSDGRNTGMRRSAATRIVKTLEGRLKIDLCKPTSKKTQFEYTWVT